VPKLSAKNLAKSYNKRQVVIDVSIDVEKGEVVGLLGPNGAGKTTCFYMIVGLVAADAGQVTIGDKDITHLPMHGRASEGVDYLPQEASIFRKLTVSENIYSILEGRKDLSRAQRQERLEQLLNEFSITHIRDSLGMALSGGERRRVEIARALAMEPKYILLDEPFAGVDPISVNEIKSIIEHVRSKDIGVLITDHNVRETLDICERAYIVGEGHIIAHGGTEDVLNNQRVKELYLGDDFQF